MVQLRFWKPGTAKQGGLIQPCFGSFSLIPSAALDFLIWHQVNTKNFLSNFLLPILPVPPTSRPPSSEAAPGLSYSGRKEPVA